MAPNDWLAEGTIDFPIATLLRFLYSSVAEEEVRCVAMAGYDTIHIAHFPILRYLYDSPENVRITDLAAWAHITKPSMVYLVNYLAEYGYVERISNESDKRVQLVQLTERGKEASVFLRRLSVNIEQKWQDQLGAQAVSQFRYLLKSLVSVQMAEQISDITGKK